MDERRVPVETSERQGPTFYRTDDELPPGAVRALERRTEEQLHEAAARATRRA